MGHDSTSGDVSGTAAHEPVMVAEAVACFAPVPAGVVVDATLGRGGHAAAILADRDDIELIGLDRDPTATSAATTRLAPFGGRVRVVRGAFAALAEHLDRLGVHEVSGALFDLGVSSPQIDDADRGFSYQRSGPLDMRMDPALPTTAADLVNDASEGELADLLVRLGDERHAGRIARAIVAARPLTTTAELAEVVRDAVPAAARGGRHPARRTFQALRMAVNDELGQLESGVAAGIDRLGPGGRCAVLSYHSGEDRIVKRLMVGRATVESPPRGLPVRSDDAPVAPFELVWRGGRRPSAEEARRNPRATSARMRAVERRRLVAPVAGGKADPS